MARGIGYELGAGPSDRVHFPVAGPYDTRLGYTGIPRMAARLDSLGFELTAQARISGAMAKAIQRGAYPTYREKSAAGLTVYGRAGLPIVTERHPTLSFESLDSIPDLVVRSLLYIESRGFLDPRYPRRNPAVEWDRLMLATAQLAVRAVGVDRSVPGGSTLATQIEKFRHSPDGLTRTPKDKLRQMFSASLRAYRNGPETLEERRQIVTDYLNSVPLAAQAGHGEVVGTADGLWAWYGTPLADAVRILSADASTPEARVVKARVYRQSLSLLIAHRRPSFYLTTPAGRILLADLTDAYLGLLGRDLVIPRWLADEARRARDHIEILARAPERPSRPFTERKAANMVRSSLLNLTGMPSFYELDRLDMTAVSGIDFRWHSATTQLLSSMRNEPFLSDNGFREPRLLAAGDPARVVYSVLLLERTHLGNVVRVQTDNFDGPFNLAGASRLELGSTAKLRTLVTYLEIMEDAFETLSPHEPDSLRALLRAAPDALTRWTSEYLLSRPQASLGDILDAAMERTYSASPAERFQTGGGVQSFVNFDDQFDGRLLSVRESFRHSVNLPFIRIMRDIVRYEIQRSGAARALDREETELRTAYLLRFADAEGSGFVRRFYNKYAGLDGPEIFAALTANRRLGHQRLAWALRAVATDVTEEVFNELMSRHTSDEQLTDRALADLYRRTDPAGQNLSDLGYLARIHPLELWVASYALHNPGSSLADHIDQSREARIEVYRWLFRTGRQNAQDQRIRTMLEVEAFQRIHHRWLRLGFPFENIVPSLGTAIGSSGDRPVALAELAGIVQSGGIRHPTVGITGLTLAEGTPYETRFERREGQAARVMSPEVAAALQSAMHDVVESGTGRRVQGSFTDEEGRRLRIGGKTGTGDNRFRVFGAGGQLIESRSINRTATFVFTAGDRFFGVVVAYVEGREADTFRFTSALPTQLLRVLGPRLEGL